MRTISVQVITMIQPYLVYLVSSPLISLLKQIKSNTWTTCLNPITLWTNFTLLKQRYRSTLYVYMFITSGHDIMKTTIHLI